MRFSVGGVGETLARGIDGALRAAGHEPGDPAELVVVGVDVPIGAELIDVSPMEWLATLAELRQAFSRIRDSARALSDGGGVIVAVVPVHSVRPSAGCGQAAIVGSFLTTVAQVAGVELAPHGVRVNVLAVGPLDGEAPAEVVEAVPIGRLVTAEDIGRVCALLAMDEAAAVTAALVTVDGGYAVTKAVGGSPFTAQS